MSVIYQNKKTTIVLKNNKIIKYAADLLHEAKVQIIAHKLGIAPQVYKSRPTSMEMEYIEGHTLDTYLRTYLRTCPIDGIDKTVLKRTLRQALDKMYEGGINHKNLTGQNVLINLKNEIKIIDYKYAELSNEPVPDKYRDYGILRNF